MNAESRDRTRQLLRRVVEGDEPSAGELVPLIYEELRTIARRLVADQRQSTLQPTELIHEAYVRLAGSDADPQYEDRKHFQRVAARAMRYVLVDRARARHSDKRGGGKRPATLDEALIHEDRANQEDTVLAVHEGLEALASVDAQLAELVELRFFGGFEMDEIATMLGVSRRTAQRSWQLARAWWQTEYDPTDDS